MLAASPRFNRPTRRTLVLAVASLAICLTALSAAVPSLAQTQPAAPPIAEKCRADLAARLSIPVDETSVVSSRPVVWPDAALGMPEPDHMYAQVMTPGFTLYLRARNTDYLYTVGKSTFRYGGPAGVWGVSVLCIQPDPGDANMNGTLVQMSALGTNLTPVLEGVSSFYPQMNGAVFAARRTSRSGLDLLYLAPGERGKGRVVASAFDVGPVALAEDGKTWAYLNRPAFAQSLSLTIRSLDEVDGKGQTFELPSGIGGAALRWDGDTLVATVREVRETKRYLLIQVGGVRSWKKLAYATRGDGCSVLLNKSESLVVEGTKVGGKPAARVYTLWFTGSQKDVAVIKDFQLQTVDMTERSRFVGISGTHGGTPAVAVVDFRSHEAIIVKGLGLSAPRLWMAPMRSVPALPGKPAE